ncbi:hypothetical protein BDY21DRAFT_407958 [Lineolata rhizophorae]|uniref:Uncharacterized protein n=1 Tax=Lineolata rhizophorae TaxID=578093 RepID=A0A6A6P7T8_9PEZI|nr:hypothetical protein BDY21DRAFT_407958 [Lineolata rhizophorae]
MARASRAGLLASVLPVRLHPLETEISMGKAKKLAELPRQGWHGCHPSVFAGPACRLPLPPSPPLTAEAALATAARASGSRSDPGRGRGMGHGGPGLARRLETRPAGERAHGLQRPSVFGERKPTMQRSRSSERGRVFVCACRVLGRRGPLL